jgi:hypothetical protein
MMPLLATSLIRGEHIRSFHISATPPVGWEVSEGEDHRVVRRRQCTDWHRVELALSRATRHIAELREQGWQEP